MANKSMGNFLSELRKEKGITQKELAELLNVSDKTVSHWECDKYSPDISVIPLLAEFFGVSCDEILKGERKPPEPIGNNFSYEALTKENEYKKYAKIRLQNAYTKLKTSMVISTFVSIFSVAIPWTICWFLEDEYYINDAFVMLPYIIFLGTCLFILLTYLSYQKFKTSLSYMNEDDPKVKSYKRKGLMIIMIPFLVCLIILFTFLWAILPADNIDERVTAQITEPPTSYYDDSTDNAPSSSVQHLYPESQEATENYDYSADHSEVASASGTVNIFTD